MHSIVLFALLCLPVPGAQSPPPAQQFAVVPFALVQFDAPLSQGLEQHPQRDHVLFLGAYAVLDQPGEVFVDVRDPDWSARAPYLPPRIAARTSEPGPITGRLFHVQPGSREFGMRRFTLEPSSDPQAKTEFYGVMQRHYQRLLDQRLPGAPWFRHQVAVARKELGAAPVAVSADAAPSTARRAADDGALELFSGALAVDENLDLDRALNAVAVEPASIDIASLRGVSTRALDWRPLVAGLSPELDPLASWIPIDQHAVFFPSTAALARTLDELESEEPALRPWLDAGVDVARLRARYGEQLCLPFSDPAGWSWASSLTSLAITGSDPFLPSGTDVAVLFECSGAAELLEGLAAHHASARARGAVSTSGTFGALRWTCVRTADRRVCSYVAASGGTVIVTNSPAQLARIAAVRDGRAEALAEADEYRWFRDRYRRADACETALLVLSDAAIRAWTGPRVRIAESRRLRAADALVEVEVRRLDALVGGTLAEGSRAFAADLPGSEDFRWSSRGVESPAWGNLGFLTPIAELDVARVTASEARAYEQFRRDSEARWRTFFDPIALRLSLEEATLAADLTVMPLVLGTEYQWLRDLARGSRLKAAAGDLHADTLFHLAWAFEGPMEDASMIDSRQLAWAGGMSLYADRDPSWERFLESREPLLDLLEGTYPLALHVEVVDDEACAGFLRELRSLLGNNGFSIEDSRWNEQAYTRLAADPYQLYCAAWPGALVIATREDVVRRAIDRNLARAAGRPAAGGGPEWLGRSAGARIEGDGLAALEHLWTDGRDERSPARESWALLPLLDDWKRRFPEVDPVALYDRFGGARLGAPRRDAYEWNERMHAMQSIEYGCPAAPRDPPSRAQGPKLFERAQFDLDFEGEGLRARATIERARR